MAASFGPSRESPWRLADEMGSWLDTFDWDAFATFTFRPETWGPTGPSGDRCLFHSRSLLEGLHPSHPVGYFLAVETGRRGRVHSHALLSLRHHGISRKSVWRAAYRRFGRAEIRPVSQAPEECVTFYVAKYLVKAPLLWDIGGCTVSR